MQKIQKIKSEEVSLSSVLNNILKVPQHMNGLEYIKNMAKNFAREMNFKYVSIGRTSEEFPFFIDTDVYIIDNQIQPNISYEIQESGLQVILSKRVFSYQESLSAFFHDNTYLSGNGITSMVGAPILSHDNNIIGILFALNETPMSNVSNSENVVEFLAGRIAVEFERMKTEEHMTKINQELEEIIEVRTVKLRNALAEINLKEQQLELRYNENVNMLRMLSHDLANPLQVLGMSVEALSDRLPPEFSRLVERMKRSTDTMGQILYLVRELQAFGAGKKELKIEPVCLDEIIEKSRFNFQDKLKEKNITLNYRGSCATTNKVLAEKVSLSNNVFNNLISNAIKFSENNSTIDITISQRDKNVVVQVSDHGIGIPEDILPNLFAYNRETSRPGTMGEKGTGFGLPLVKLFLDLYKVKVSISSVTKEQNSLKHGTDIELIFQSAA